MGDSTDSKRVGKAFTDVSMKVLAKYDPSASNLGIWYGLLNFWKL